MIADEEETFIEEDAPIEVTHAKSEPDKVQESENVETSTELQKVVSKEDEKSEAKQTQNSKKVASEEKQEDSEKEVAESY